MRYWYDTEFMEDGERIVLLSIGMVCEDGRELYAETDANQSMANDWVKENVLPLLTGEKQSRAAIRDALTEFCDPVKHGKPEFWGYYADYDHVALCQLFGRMIDLPDGWPMYTRDIKQLVDDLGNPRLEQGANKHNALDDARWNRWAWLLLDEMRRRRNGAQ